MQPGFFKYLFFILVFVSGILFNGYTYGQRELIFKRKLVIKCTNPEHYINICNYGLLVPATRPGRQEITEFKYSIAPNNVLKTESNEYFLQWKKLSFAQLNKTNLEVSMKVKLTAYDLKAAKKKPLILKQDQDTLTYLKDEENFRFKAKSIQDAAATIKGNDREEIVKAIFNYVVASLDYHIFIYQNRGAKQALKDGRGDCTEYSELMITLCRAKNIPARIVKGIIPRTTGEIGYHNWVEVYFTQYGWVAFDPTWADHPMSTTTFYSMKNTYIQTSNKRFIDDIQYSCKAGEFDYTIRLKDTSIDLFNGITGKIKAMLSYYNGYNLVKAEELLDTLLIAEPDNYRFWVLKGVINARLDNFDKGYECLQNASGNAESLPEKCECLYGFSNFYALKGDGEKAVDHLKQALDLGFENYDHILKDPDLEKIKDYPPFVELKKEIKERAEKKLKK